MVAELDHAVGSYTVHRKREWLGECSCLWNKMLIGIFGLGYVGLTTAACLVRRGHMVIGYEISAAKRAELESGRCPISEPGLESELGKALGEGRLSVAAEPTGDVMPEVVLVCVGTPSAEGGSTDLTSCARCWGK